MLGVDKFIRTLGLYALAESGYAVMEPESQKLFQAYADGVNDWVATHPHSLPAEFALLGIRPEPWAPADSVVWGKLMALQLSKNYRLEVLRAQLTHSHCQHRSTHKTATVPPPSSPRISHPTTINRQRQQQQQQPRTREERENR
jgi:penicillin amidase